MPTKTKKASLVSLYLDKYADRKRKKKWTHKPGEYTLTANFRRPADAHRIALVGALSKHFTLAAIAYMLGDVSQSTVAKMVRVFYASHR
jgi:hypothetical protein